MFVIEQDLGEAGDVEDLFDQTMRVDSGEAPSGPRRGVVTGDEAGYTVRIEEDRALQIHDHRGHAWNSALYRPTHGQTSVLRGHGASLPTT
jgi:hypothetical protein